MACPQLAKADAAPPGASVAQPTKPCFRVRGEREACMARAERLLELIQVLRRHRHPVSGQTLSDELGVSLRTVYRDIHALIGQGAPIDGEAGVGYVLRPGF